MNIAEAVRRHMCELSRKGAAAHAANRNATLAASERAALLGERALMSAGRRALPADIARHLVMTNTWGEATSSNVKRSLDNARRKLERQPLLAEVLDSKELEWLRSALGIQRGD